MSEQQPVLEQQETAAEQPKPVLEFGFTVGVQEDGGVFLETLGTKKGLVQMLGLIKYAEYHFNYTLDQATGSGYPLIAHQVKQLGEMMKVLLNMVGQPNKEQSRIITP